MAQLELSVVLNLANFRTQLGKLAQASAAYYYPVNLTIDKQAFKKQLVALGNIKPVIKIDDSQLDGARARITTLNKSLATLRRATATPIEIKLKYVEVGKPASAAAGQIGRAVSGGVRGSQALEGVGRSELLNIRKMMSEAGMALGKITSLSKATASELRASIVPAFTNSGEQAINGLAIGLKDSSSKIGKIAAKVGTGAVNGIKVALGIASPSRVFKQIGKFSVDGLEIGFINGLKDFKTKAVAEIKSIVKSLRQEARVGMIAAGGLLSPVAGPRTASTRTIPGVSSPRDVVSNQDPGRSNNRILNSLSLLTGDPKLYRSRMANLGANRLPSSLLGSAATQMNLEGIAPSFKEARLGGTKTGVANIIDEAFFGRGTLPKASSALNALSNTIERLASSARAAAPSGILQSASGNPRFRAFGGVPSSQSMGIFPPTAQPTVYPPSGGFLEFSRRATAISAGLPGNVFGGRGGGAGGGSGGGGGRGPGGGGTVPPGGFPIDDVMVTRNARLGTVMDVAAASTRNFTASQIPLVGGIKSLAGEFGEATKQVLLYGTAYKGLAFLTSLPGQILNAAKSQQQFNNGLQVATQDTGTFAKELLYVDNVQRAFGLNLETTRTGFTRLYASMAPTGFDSGSIEKLFTGISAATASLQLTPDKAERVIYAFGQMASKGQIMSEELKGQLGDVLPGALAIFSKAAGMSVKEFSEAMEDGEFVGNRFREVFAKVSDELMNRFGTGAQVAGRSLQGLINTVGGDFQRTLESFAPLANAAAQATLGPLTGMLREVSMAAQIAMGEQDRVRKQLEAAQTDVSLLRAGGADAKEIKAAEQNVAALAAKYEVLNEAARDPAISQQVKNIEAFVAEIQKAATFTMNLAGVIGSILNPLFTFLGGNLTSVVGNLALLVLGFNAAKVAALLMMGVVNTMTAIQGITSAGAASTTILAGAFRLLGVQATGAQVATIGFGVAIKGLLISTGIGAVIVLLGSLATAFLSVGNKAKEAADRAKRSIDSMADAARTGNVSLIEMELAVNKADRQDVENLIKKVEGLTGKRRNVAGGGSVEMVTLSPELKREAKRLGIEVAGEVTKGSILGSLGELRKPLKEAALSGEEDLVAARKRAEKLGQNIPDLATTTADTQAEEDKKKTSLESYYSLQDQLAKNFTQAEIDRLEVEHQHKIDLIKSEYDLKEAKANSFQKEALRFERRMAEITLERQGALLKASNAVMAAQGSVAGGAAGGAASGGQGLGAGIAQYITGDPASPFYRADHGGGNYHEHLAFVSRQAAEEAYKKLTSAGIKVTEFKGKSKVGGHTPGSAHYEGLAFDVPGSQVPVGQERGLTARVQSVLGIGGSGAMAAGAGAARKVPSSEKRDIVADQKTQLEQVKQSATARQAEAKAIKDAEVALADFVATATPVEEQKLQNDLLKRRTDLMMQGYSDSAVDQAMKFAEAEYKVNFALKLNEELERKGARTKAEAAAIAKQMTEGLTAYSSALEENTIRLRDNQLAQAMTVLKDRMAMAGAMTPDQELREQIRQKNPDFTPERQEGLFQQEKLVQGAEKLKADMQGIASSIGDSFGTAFKGIITGSMTAQEALAGMFQSIADYFADMVAKMIAEWIKMMVLKGIEAIINPMAGLGNLAGGIGGGLSSGFSAGASSAIDTSAAGWGAAFNTPLKFANGGITSGGFQAFANGGVVTGPTLGLVGEGRYNEAVIPLPDGRSVPVELSGGGSSSPTVIVNVDAKGSQVEGNEQNANQLGRAISAAVQTELIKQQRPGGLLAR